MATLVGALALATQLAFILLALGTLVDWIRHRDRQRTFLIFALVSLSLLVLIGPMSGALGLPQSVVTDIDLVLFLLSGYFLLLFRDSLIPLGPTPRWIISGIVFVVAVAAVAADLPSNPATPRTTYQVGALLAVVVTWVVCVTEPIVRLGLASIGRPAVEGARLRALSLGYAGLVVVVIFATVTGSFSRQPGVIVATDLIVLAVVPLLYASFSPPAWLRRVWAYPEQDEIRRALHDLLLYSPNRTELARRAVDRAARLVGGASAYITDWDGSILAAHGITSEEALRTRELKAGDTSVVVVPLDLEQGKGSMTVLAGPFTPVFGQYELGMLRGYAVSITAGLDRVSLTERVARLEKAKTEFLNIASHELRSPMTVIKGYLTMFAAGALGSVPPQAERVLPLLIAKSDEIDSMVEQMIEASRLEDGKLALKRERCDLGDLTEAAITAMRPLIGDHDVELDKPRMPVWALVDPDRYQIVVRNLVSNAVKYSPVGSSVTVRLHPDSANVTLAVADNGIGIATEDQPRLFTRFGRIETRATLHTAGTGLGLWLSREIARMHDGDLTVESELGKGSTFTLEIPIDRR